MIGALIRFLDAWIGFVLRSSVFGFHGAAAALTVGVPLMIRDGQYLPALFFGLMDIALIVFLVARWRNKFKSKRDAGWEKD